MSCVYEAESISFSCIMDIVNDIRTRKVDTLTARKIIKQVDCALAQFGSKPPIGVASVSQDELLNAIESQCSVSSAGAIVQLAVLVPQLIQLLKIVIEWND